MRIGRAAELACRFQASLRFGPGGILRASSDASVASMSHRRLSDDGRVSPRLIRMALRLQAARRARCSPDRPTHENIPAPQIAIFALPSVVNWNFLCQRKDWCQPNNEPTKVSRLPPTGHTALPLAGDGLARKTGYKTRKPACTNESPRMITVLSETTLFRSSCAAHDNCSPRWRTLVALNIHVNPAAQARERAVKFREAFQWP